MGVFAKKHELDCSGWWLSGSGILAGMTTVPPQAAHPLAAQDMTRILTYLQSSSGTTAEIARALRLTVNRVNGLLMELQKQGFVQVDRCTTNGKGMSVNVWVCRKSIREVCR